MEETVEQPIEQGRSRKRPKPKSTQAGVASARRPLSARSQGAVLGALRHRAASLALLGVAACDAVPASPPRMAMAAVTPLDRPALARARVFFLHMSVGANVVDGVAGMGVAIDSVGLAAPIVLEPGVITQASFGQNGAPRRKIALFQSLFAGDAFSLPPDVVLMKLCFDDFYVGTDINDLIERYARAVEVVRQHSPQTRVIHVTAPLVRGSSGVTEFVKRITGVGDEGMRRNIIRARYNEGLRRRFAGEVFFDLERVESVGVDGASAVAVRDGRAWPTLAPGLTDDGAHLNPRGQSQAAHAFLSAVTQALDLSPSTTLGVFP